jgi:allantoinase
LGLDLICKGLSADQIITSDMSKDEEQLYIHGTLERFQRATGTTAKGWMSPEYSNSLRTPELLAKAGVLYTLDWGSDEQPIRMVTSAGDIWALPVNIEYDDCYALLHEAVSIDEYVGRLRRGLSHLSLDGKEHGRTFVPTFRPWLMGQPFRAGALERLARELVSSSKVWVATPEDIIVHYREILAGEAS